MDASEGINKQRSFVEKINLVANVIDSCKVVNSRDVLASLNILKEGHRSLGDLG